LIASSCNLHARALCRPSSQHRHAWCAPGCVLTTPTRAYTGLTAPGRPRIKGPQADADWSCVGCGERGRDNHLSQSQPRWWVDLQTLQGWRESHRGLFTPCFAYASGCPKVPLLADHTCRSWSIQCSPHAPSTRTTAEHQLTCAHLHTCDHTNIQDCFERTPVPFAEGMSQVLRMHSGEETSVEPVYLSDGTWPPNSTWAMNPIPECCKSSCSFLACILFVSKAGC
jgi:hypothetical protein